MLLNELKERFLGKEFKLLELDNDMQLILNRELEDTTYVNSIFDYNVREMLENSFCYNVGACSGYNFTFEIIEDSEDELNIIVKVIDIDEV